MTTGQPGIGGLILKHLSLAIKVLKNYPSPSSYQKLSRGVGEKTARNAIEVSADLRLKVLCPDEIVHQRLKRFYILANSVVLVMRRQELEVLEVSRLFFLWGNDNLKSSF